jgi:hypothetical protein
LSCQTWATENSSTRQILDNGRLALMRDTKMVGSFPSACTVPATPKQDFNGDGLGVSYLKNVAQQRRQP